MNNIRESPESKMKLEQLPLEVQRTIAEYLPINAHLRNIAVACRSGFTHMILDDVVFARKHLRIKCQSDMDIGQQTMHSAWTILVRLALRGALWAELPFAYKVAIYEVMMRSTSSRAGGVAVSVSDVSADMDMDVSMDVGANGKRPSEGSLIESVIVGGGACCSKRCCTDDNADMSFCCNWPVGAIVGARLARALVTVGDVKADRLLAWLCWNGCAEGVEIVASSCSSVRLVVGAVMGVMHRGHGEQTAYSGVVAVLVAHGLLVCTRHVLLLVAWAATANNVAVLQLFLADKSVDASVFGHAFDCAVRSGCEEAATLLLAHPRARPYLLLPLALTMALQQRHTRMLAMLLRETLLLDSNLDTLLQHAVIHDMAEFAALLLDHKHTTPLLHHLLKAIQLKHFHLVTLLLDDGRIDPREMSTDVIINAARIENWTLLSLLLKDGRVQVLAILDKAMTRNEYAHALQMMHLQSMAHV
ncbi:hypothetical protein HDU81_001882 [Chytriomyces hyalinus]|nr:hypothetical protein HDU81_001882 [Chytriomyces hyalinus]